MIFRDVRQHSKNGLDYVWAFPTMRADQVTMAVLGRIYSPITESVHTHSFQEVVLGIYRMRRSTCPAFRSQRGSSIQVMDRHKKA